MADDLSSSAEGSMVPTGAAADASDDPRRAFAAPGGKPAQWDVAEPDPVVVHEDATDARQLVRGAEGGQGEGRWDDVSGERKPWR
jgi:hypothetical protein